jgi:cytochrome c-type biogenesis protein CcmH/NrfF
MRPACCGRGSKVIRRLRIPYLLACLVLFGGVWVPNASPQKSERAKALGEKITCMCGGCNDAAGLCKHSGGAFAGPCDVARNELNELDQRVNRGESDDLTLQAFIQEYGPTVILVPPAKGFDLWAWIMPVLLPIVALGLIAFMVQRWRRRAAVAAPVHVPAELLARARHDTEFED